jgi:hypothetical protein
MLAMSLYREPAPRSDVPTEQHRLPRLRRATSRSWLLIWSSTTAAGRHRQAAGQNPLRVLIARAGHGRVAGRRAADRRPLCDDCRDHFADVRGLLDELDQTYTINFRLCAASTTTPRRGGQEGIGAQAALCGGGRYDGYGGHRRPATPGVGDRAGRGAAGLRRRHYRPTSVGDQDGGLATGLSPTGGHRRVWLAQRRKADARPTTTARFVLIVVAMSCRW